MIDDDEQILKRQRPLGDAVGDALAYGTLRDRKDFNWVDIKSGAAMMSYRHSIATTASDEGSCDANNNNLLSADNLLRLALKKPKSWKWELTTSSSSPNISFPKIQLYDGVSGELMVEVDQPDCVIRSDGSDVGRVPAEQSVLLQSSSSSRELDTRPGRYRRSRTSLVKEKLSTSGESLADIFNQLQNKGLGHKLSTSGSQYRLINGADVEDGRGSLQKSKSANAIGVPDAPPIIRRRSRRSLASRSSSILERISEFYGRSSTEEDDGRDLQLVVPAVPQLVLPAARDDPPAQPDADGVTIEEIPAEPSTTPIKPRPKIYKLVRSNIGTLMVREESFHTQSSLRRRQRENGELPSTAPDSERLVELDGRTERPRPMDNGEGELFRYEREINHIDGLLSRVMLSHDLQTEDIRQDAPSIRISRPPEVATPVNGSTPYQNGTTHRKRRSRRSVSVGASVNSPHRRSLSSERNHSPTNPYRPGQRNGRRSASSSSTSDTELGPKSEEHRTGSSSRSGSQKRRGRTRHRGGQSNDTPDSSSRAAISNGDQLISRTGEPECQRQSLPERTESSSQPNSFTGGNSITAPCKGEPVRKPPQTITLSHDVSDQAELRPLVSERAVVRSKGKSSSNGGSNTTVSSFLADSYNASDKVLQKLVQSLGRSLNTRKRDRLEAKRKGGSSWLRHVPGCCSGSGKSVSPPARDSIVLRTGTCLRYRNERNRLPSVTTDNLLDRNTPSTGRQITSTDQEDERAFGGEYGIADERFLPPAGNGTSDRFIFDRLQLEFPVVEPAVELICYQHHSTDEDEDDDDDDSYDNDTNEYEHDDPRVPACGERTCALQRSASERTDRNRRTRTNMGANVSSSARQHAKGLTSGRRAQSIDNLKSDTTQYFHQYHNNNNGDTFHHQTFLADTAGSNADGEGLEKQPPPPDLACLPGTGQIPPEQQQHQQDHVIYVSRKDRNKFCGSLPNHLDLDASTIDRDCEAIVKQNEFLQANLKNVQQHQQQQQQQTATRTGCNQTGGPNPSPPNGSQQQLTFGGSVPVDHTTAGSQQQLQNLPPQLPTYQQHQDSPLHCSSTATQGPPNTSGPGGVGLVDGVGGSTFRSSEACGSGQQQQVGTIAANLQLKLPLHRTAIDAGCDQGYGSERSPEDDLPPPLLLMHETQYIEILASSSSSIGSTAPCQQLPVECVGSSTAPLQQGEQQHTQPCWTHSTNTGQLVVGPYSFITKDSIFFVQVSKGSRGLGFSVSGGTDSSAPYPGLIRIKRLFPHQAAWATGMLQPGDILLEANGVPLTGLTNYLALEVLRKATNVVTLTVCRPKDEQYRKLSPPTEPPRPPLRNALSYEQGQGSNSVPQSPLPAGIPFQHQQQQIHHFFPPPNARNPQLQTVGGYLPSHDPMQTSFSGEFEIVLTKQQGSLGFTLRKEDESVLGHYVRALVREPALSDGRIRPGDKIVAVNDVPVSSMSHEEAVIFLRQAADVVRLRLYRDQAQTPLSAHSPIESSLRGRTRLLLRPEAINLLTDLAANRFHRAAAGSGSSVASSHTNSPRRLRRVGAHQAGFDNHGFQQQQQQQQQHSNDTFNYSDSCSNASTIVSQAVDDLDDAYYCDEEIDAIVASEDRTSGGEEHGPRPRPTFLDLEAGTRFQLGSGGTTVQQLNNLDRDTLNAPLRYGLGGGAGTPGLAGPDPDGANFVSLPCETFLVACKTEQDLQQAGDQTEAIYVQHFAHKSPLYSSVNVPARVGAAELVDAVERGGKKSLMKWKGATLLGDEEERHEPEKVADLVQEQQDTLVTPDADDSSLAATAGTTLSTATPTTERELFDLNASCGTDSEGNQIFTVELNKGWNSRLGFSLKQDTGANGSIRTVISAIYRDSVAARDGRLRVGDVLIMVNEESVEAVPTAQVIELMRIVRGAIFITLLRPSGAGGAEGTLEPTPEEPTSVEPSGNVTPVHSSDYVAVGNRDASNATSSTVKKQEETSDPTEVSTEGQ